MANERMAAWFPHIQPGADIDPQDLDGLIGDAARRWSFQMDLADLEQEIHALRTEVDELRTELRSLRATSGSPTPDRVPPPFQIDGA